MKSSAPLFRLDLSRGLFLGILESSFGVFVLLICIRYFDAPDYCKGLIAAGGSIGLLATSLLVAMWSNSRTSEPMKCAIYMLLSGVFI
ncbi:MAG: MFS transporter, partial [Verrucomicrobiota bacterium]|nr:MFS transporter [Verrucomicrobiota bacterium]